MSEEGNGDADSSSVDVDNDIDDCNDYSDQHVATEDAWLCYLPNFSLLSSSLLLYKLYEEYNSSCTNTNRVKY